MADTELARVLESLIRQMQAAAKHKPPAVRDAWEAAAALVGHEALALGVKLGTDRG